MPQTWEWGPWASQSEDMRQQAEKDAAAKALQDQTSNNALRNLLEGKKFDEQAKIATEDRAATQAVPGLRRMLTGETGQALGFQGTEPDEAYRSFAKSVPGIAQTVLGKRLENVGVANKPVTVSKDAALVSPKGELLYKNQGPEQQGGISFPTPEAAQAYWQSWQARDAEGTKGYSPQIMADPTHGGYKLNLMRGEPLTPPDPFKLQYESDVKSMGPEKALANYKKNLAESQGMKQAATQANTIPPMEYTNAMLKVNKAAQAFGNLEGFSEPERQAFVGAQIKGIRANKNELFNYLGMLPGGAAMVQALGGSDKVLDRYNQFHTLHGAIRELAFVTGGKQLTSKEEEVVLAALPTGNERNYSEYKAKYDYARLLIQATQEAMIQAQNTYRDQLTNDQMADTYRRVFSQYGISTTDKDSNIKKFLTPDARLRDKYGR